jgi:hypothetical protein
MPADLDTTGEERLRAALVAAASGPVDPAWDAIRSQVLGEEHTIRLVPTRRSRPVRRPAVLAAAAAVVVVIALAGAVALTNRSGTGDHLTQVGGDIGDPTPGWFVPRDLPAGWTVTSVQAVRPDEPRCPGPEEEPARGIRWVRPDSSPNAVIVVTTGRCDTDEGYRGPGDEPIVLPDRAPPVDVELGPVTGSFAESLVGSDHRITWERDGVTWTFEATGMQIEEVVSLAREVATAATFDAAPTRFQEEERWTEAPAPRTTVEVRMTSPEGVELAYVIGPSGGGTFRGRVDGGRDRPEGMPGDHRWDLSFVTAPWTLRFALVAPGVDVDVWIRRADDDPAVVRRQGAETLDAPVRLLAESLAPATTEEWEDLLAGVDHTPVLDDADTFADLADLDVPPPR